MVLELLAIALCAEPPPPADRLEVPTVVITAGRREQQPLEAPRSVDFVDQERMSEHQGSSLPDVLEEAPGVFMQRTNLGAGAPILRGFIGPQTLTLFDGVRLTSGITRTGPNQYLHLIDPAGLDRVEIVRGPSAVLYGNGAMGGVIQALSLDPKPAPYWVKGRARFHTADFGGGADVRGSARFGDVALIAGGAFEQAGTLRLGGGEDAPLSEFTSGGGQFKAIWEPTGNTELRLSYVLQAIDDAGRVDDLGKGDVRLYDNLDHLMYLRFRRTGDWLRDLSATFSYRRLEERVARATCETKAVDEKTKVVKDAARCRALDYGAFTKRTNNEDLVDTFGGDVSADFAFWDDRALIQVGAEFYGDLVSSTQEASTRDETGAFPPFKEAARGSFSDGSEYLSFGAFAHGTVTAFKFSDRDLELRIGTGVRVSTFAAKAPSVPDLGDVEYDFTGLVGSAEVQLVWPETLNVYATFLQGFRAPNLQETTVLGDTGTKFELPNPNLEPERSNTIELGTKVHIENVSVSVAWFYSMLIGAITDEATTYQGAETFGDAAKPVSWRVNADSGHLQGIEASIKADFWRFTAAYSMSWLDGEVELADGKKVPLRRLPPVFGTASLRYTLPDRKAYAELGVSFAGARRDLNPGDEKDPRICETAPHSGLLQKPCDGTGPWFSLNARVGWQFLPNLRADLALTNLLDQSFRRHGSGYDAAGIDARVSVTAEF